MKIQIIENHAATRGRIREQLRRRPDWQVVAETGDGGEALDQASQQVPELILLSRDLATASARPLVQQLREVVPAARIVVLASTLELRPLRQALAGGAQAVVPGDAAEAELLCAIEAVSLDGVYLTRAAAARLFPGAAPSPARDRLRTLSPREMQVLQLIVAGHQGKEIAERLGVSLSSAGTYRERLLRKLGCTSTAGLVRLAIEDGLVE
ncbi:MAG TPA: response regulator transcription factor [Opitutaceae bacterium]|nr:response regulator transcription factor [Opitutaceae bacterium]